MSVNIRRMKNNARQCLPHRNGTNNVQDNNGNIAGRGRCEQQHNFLFLMMVLNLNIQTQLMQARVTVTQVCLLLLLLAVPALAAFDITSLVSKTCNIQTTLEFQFSPNTILSSASSPTDGAASTLQFLTAAGNDVALTLHAATYQKTSQVINFVKGYGSRSATFNATPTSPTAAFIFQFGSTAGNIVYVYVPVVSDANASSTLRNNPDVIDLTLVGTSLKDFKVGPTGALNAFNILVWTEFNQWYTAVGSNGNTILVSNFIYRVTTASTDTAATTPSTLTAVIGETWNTATTGDKLCYASTITTGNFQTHIRQSVPLWFAWFWIFFYWLFYLIADHTNVKVYDPYYEDNRWTCVALYSLANLAHEECFTRLSRVTVILINWTIQGVIIACIYGNQFLGAPMIIWTAVIAFVATLPVPFLWGYLIHRKIYEKNLVKYENMKAMKGVIEKEKLEPHQQAIDTCEEKLYGYYHWFYSAAFVLTFICWPIAINQMQKLPRTLYHYHWYWLASMGIVFALEYFIFEPLFTLLFGNSRAMRTRGGYFYNFKLGQAYRAAQTY